MTVLKVIGWIIVVIIGLQVLFLLITSLLLSVKVTLGIDLGESGTRFRFKYGFFGIKVYPELFTPEKKEKFKRKYDKFINKFGPLIDKIKYKISKKMDKKKAKKGKKEKEELTFDSVFEKIKYFDYEGAYKKAKDIFNKLGSFGGIMELLKYIASRTSNMAKKMLKALTFKELYIDFTVCGKDAADTAMNYGKTSAAAFPLLGILCTNLKIREYDLNINADFLANKNSGDLHTVVSFRPIRFVMILTGYGIKLFNKVIFTMLFSKNESSKDTNKKQKSKLEIGGA